MTPNFRFRIEPVGQRYQVQIGLEFDRGYEFIPAHRSAFARHLSLADLHDDAAGAQSELAQLTAWLEGRQPERAQSSVELAG